MQLDFHYYATYCASYIAGYTHRESLDICYSAQFVDCCTRTLLSKIGGPSSAATTQLQLEMMEARTDLVGLQDITRIWSSFHFLPRDLYADIKKGSGIYKNKMRLICGTNSALLEETVKLASDSGLQAAGLAMHVLADTWAHRYFAGTPSLVINNTDNYFYELIPEEGGMNENRSFKERKLSFKHNPSEADDIENGVYINTIFQLSENSVMSLGHGRAGHLPDYSFVRYKYLPAWGDYEELVKDNPYDYYNAFCQMIYALKCLSSGEVFERDRYDREAAAPYEERIRQILEKRQRDSSLDWKTFGEELSGQEIPDFDEEQYQEDYKLAPYDQKEDTFLGKFIVAAMKQKSMVTNRIYKSGSLMAGYSIDYNEKGFGGISDFKMLVRYAGRGVRK